MENPKFREAITKFRICAHKFSIGTGRYENKAQCNRICPLYCEGIGNEIHYFNECNDNVIAETRDSFKTISNKMERCRSNNLRRTM